MASPWVKSFGNEPGGGLNFVMKANNALANENVLRQINQIKKQYEPATLQANAASKLAYSNLMYPQFMAKLMQNPGFLGNTSEEQKRNYLKMLEAAGMGQGTGMNAFNQMQGGQGGGALSGIGQPSTNSFSERIKNAFHSLVGQKPQQQSGGNNSLNMPSQGYDNSSNPGVSAEGPGPIDSGSPFVGRQGHKPHPANQKQPKGGVMIEGQQWYDKNGNPVYDEEVDISGDPTMNLKLTKGKKNKTYAEKTGEYKGIVEEGKELGRIRAASKKELDQDYQQALQLKQPFERLTKIITNPTFQNLRNIPGVQKLQMNGKATFGTPEEKKLIGEFQAAARQVVSATVKGFGGRILASEIPLSESMKLSDNDSIEAMLGKAPVIEEFNEMTLQRSRIASKLMKDYHLDKGDALEQADKMVDGEKIRNKIETELNPISEDDIAHTAKENGMTREQVIQRLKAEGRYNG